MGICRKERKQTGKNFQREDGGPAEGERQGGHCGLSICRPGVLDSVEVALPRCRPGSAEPLTRALTSLPHFSQKEWVGRLPSSLPRQTQGVQRPLVCLLGISLTTGRETEAARGGGHCHRSLSSCLWGEWGLSFHCTMWDHPHPPCGGGGKKTRLVLPWGVSPAGVRLNPGVLSHTGYSGLPPAPSSGGALTRRI